MRSKVRFTSGLIAPVCLLIGASSHAAGDPPVGGYVDSARAPTLPRQIAPAPLAPLPNGNPLFDDLPAGSRRTPDDGLTAAPKSNPAKVEDAPTPRKVEEPAKLAIDLPYALRLVNAANPTIAISRERLEQANARLQQAHAAFLPDVWVGGNPDNYTFLPTFYHHGGNIQNASGDVFSVTKNFVSVPAGGGINYKLADVLFAPRIARDLIAAEQARVRIVRDDVQLDVALTYLDLLRAYGALAVNAETIDKATQMVRYAEDAERAGLGKTTADANRARTELEIRRQERLDLEGQAAVVAARLAQLLLLEPSVDLVPADRKVVPITLVPTDPSLEDLIAVGLMNRPEMAESRALVAAALTRWRQDRRRPLLPTLSVVYYNAQFGGGSDIANSPAIHNMGGRDDFMAQAAWELKGAGLGDYARARESRSRYNEATLHVIESQAMVAAQITGAAKVARVRQQSLESAQEAVRQAEDMWTRLSKAAFGLAGGARRYDPLEPLIALQQLDRARTLYLDAVLNYNRQQFRLYWALGQPPEAALPSATALPLTTSVLPPKEKPQP
jgi:outer membrane protein TolC